MFRKVIVTGLCVVAFVAMAFASRAVATENNTRVADAAMKGDRAAVLALVKQGADVNGAQGDDGRRCTGPRRTTTSRWPRRSSPPAPSSTDRTPVTNVELFGSESVTPIANDVFLRCAMEATACQAYNLKRYWDMRAPSCCGLQVSRAKVTAKSTRI